MNLIQRATDILLKPEKTWPSLEQEPATSASILKSYLVFLAVIPALAGAPGDRMVELSLFGLQHRFSFIADCLNILAGYGITLALVFVTAYVVDSLAPTFGGVRSKINALKLVAYGATAAFLGAFFFFSPVLFLVGVPAALYSFYLMYLGLPTLMKCSPEEAVTYLAVTSCYVALIIAAAIVAAVLLGRAGDAVLDRLVPHVKSWQPTSPTGKKSQVEAKAAGTNSSATTPALPVELKPMTGSADTLPLPAEILKAQLPNRVIHLPMTSVEAESGQGAGIPRSSAKASYVDGDRRVDLSITDMGMLGGVVAATGWAKATLDRQTPGMIERIYTDGPRRVREIFRRERLVGEIGILLANGVMVEVKGQGVDLKSLHMALNSVKLADIEAMQRQEK